MRESKKILLKQLGKKHDELIKILRELKKYKDINHEYGWNLSLKALHVQHVIFENLGNEKYIQDMIDEIDNFINDPVTQYFLEEIEKEKLKKSDIIEDRKKKKSKNPKRKICKCKK